MDKASLEAMRFALRSGLEKLEGISVCCQSCEHFADGACNRFDSDPPPEVQKTGCDEWAWNGCPI